jgi:hypothetical protein
VYVTRVVLRTVNNGHRVLTSDRRTLRVSAYVSRKTHCDLPVSGDGNREKNVSFTAIIGENRVHPNGSVCKFYDNLRNRY